MKGETTASGRTPEVAGKIRRFGISVLHLYFRWSRGMTMGVRAACFDDEGRIFLVRHTYVPGWYLPGGGIERDETAEAALEKELREEGNLVLLEPATLFRVYLNQTTSRRDHVLLYRARVRQNGPRPPDREIAECGFFALHDLPEGTTRATRERLAELAGQSPPSAYW